MLVVFVVWVVLVDSIVSVVLVVLVVSFVLVVFVVWVVLLVVRLLVAQPSSPSWEKESNRREGDEFNSKPPCLFSIPCRLSVLSSGSRSASPVCSVCYAYIYIYIAINLCSYM